MALEIEEGDLEGGVDGVDGGPYVEHAAEAGARPAGLPPQHVDDSPPKRSEVERVESGDRGGHSVEPGEVRLVGVRLSQPEQPVCRVDLDDRAQRPGLMDADDVEQWRVAEGDRRDDDAGDLGRGHRAGLTASTGTSSVSRSRCAALPIMSLPTGDRRRRPRTTIRAEVPLQSGGEGVDDVAAVIGVVDPCGDAVRCGSRHQSGVDLVADELGVDGAAAARAVEDDDVIAVRGGLGDAGVESRLAGRGGHVADEHGHRAPASWSVDSSEGEGA